MVGVNTIDIQLSIALGDLFGGLGSDPEESEAVEPTEPDEPDELDLIAASPELPPVVCPFRVIVDTREQTPWHFTGLRDDKSNQTLNVPLITDRSLAQGDYAVEGLESWCVVERKSLKDFYRSISGDRDRFEREVARLNELCHVSAVVIEADWSEILDPGGFTKVTAKTATRTMAYWSVDYPRVHWITSVNRRHAEIQCFRFLEAGWKRWTHAREEERKAS